MSNENVPRITRRMMPLRSQVGYNATQQNHRPIIHEVHHDHNYGERRHHAPPLSRHQRNVDELENQDERESLSSRLRHRTLVYNSNIRTNSTNTPITNNRRPTRSTRLQNSERSDSEDNTPLNIVASSSRHASSNEHFENHTNRRSLRRRRIASDEEQVCYISFKKTKNSNCFFLSSAHKYITFYETQKT